jgi:hypothetical protein
MCPSTVVLAATIRRLFASLLYLLKTEIKEREAGGREGGRETREGARGKGKGGVMWNFVALDPTTHAEGASQA